MPRSRYKQFKENNSLLHLQIRCTGEALTGKTTLFMEFARWNQRMNGPQQVYVIHNDDRVKEYYDELGESVLEPDEDIMLQTPLSVLEGVQRDIRANAFKSVCCMVYDNMSNPFILKTSETQAKSFAGQGSSGAAEKANVMKVIKSTLQLVPCPVFAISHTYDASKRNVEVIHHRDTISNVELSRLDAAFNLQVECIKQGESKYGVKILQYRYAHKCPNLVGRIFWDKPGNMFRGFFDELVSIISGSVSSEEAKDMTVPKWQEYGMDLPFSPSRDRDQFRRDAIAIITQFHVESDGHQFFAYGSDPFGTDPNSEVVKKNGEPGINGAINHAGNVYDKLLSGRYEGYEKPKSFQRLTVALKEITEQRVQARIAQYQEISSIDEEAMFDDPVQEELIPQ